MMLLFVDVIMVLGILWEINAKAIGVKDLHVGN